MTETRFEHFRDSNLFRISDFVLRIYRRNLTMKQLVLVLLLLTGATVFAAPKAKNERPKTAPLPKTPDKTASAVQLTGNETPEQLATAYANAIKGLLAGLASADAGALTALEATCHNAARPGAEAERLACASAIAAALNAADTAPRTKSHLLHQLQLIGKAEVVPTLVKLLKDADSHVASDAQIALDNNPACPEQNRSILPPLATTPRQAKFTALRASLLAAGDNAAPKMLELLAGDDADGRAVALGMIKDLSPAGRKKLVAGADKLPPMIKGILIESLANLDDKSVLPLALAGLKSADPLLQAGALNALGRLDSPEADAAVLSAMNDATGDAKVNLINIVGQRGKRSAVPALFAVAEGSDANAAKAAYRALGDLVTAADARKLLTQLTAEKFALRSDAESVAAKALARIESPDARAVLVEDVFGAVTKGEARCSALRMFRFCSGPKALRHVREATLDSDPIILEAAVRALADWPDASAWDSLIAIHTQPVKPSYGVLAWRGLVRMTQDDNKQPNPATLGRYRQLLAEARNDDERRRVLGALGSCDHVAALDLAVAQLATPNLRAEAELALKNIAELVKKHHPKEAKAALQKLKPQ
jgi:HEAT repeat protein